MAKAQRHVDPQIGESNDNANEDDRKPSARTESQDSSSHVRVGTVGYTFRKFFQGYGWFDGEVVATIGGAEQGRYVRVHYSDGDCEDLSMDELRKLPRLNVPKKKEKNEVKSKTLEQVPSRRSNRELKPSKKLLLANDAKKDLLRDSKMRSLSTKKAPNIDPPTKESGQRLLPAKSYIEDTNKANASQLTSEDECANKAAEKEVIHPISIENDETIPVRKSSRDVKPTRKLEEYYIHELNTISIKNKSRETSPPAAKKRKLLSSLDHVPIDKAAESTMQFNGGPEITETIDNMEEEEEEEDDEERGWFVKVATLLSADTSTARAKRDRFRPIQHASLEDPSDALKQQQSCSNEIASDVASACSTISFSSDIDGTRVASQSNNEGRARLKQPPEAVLVSQSPDISASVAFRSLSDYKHGTRHGLKVFHKDDKHRIVREVILERKNGWVEVNNDGSLTTFRISQLRVVPSDRFNVGDQIPRNYAAKAPATVKATAATSPDKKLAGKLPSPEDFSASTKKVSSPNKRPAEPIADMDSLFYWHCEACFAVNKFSDHMCHSCDSTKTPKSSRSTLLQIAECAAQKANTVEDAMAMIPSSDCQSIPELVISVLMDPASSEFCVQPSKNLDTYFYWICGFCTMQNSYKKWKCSACLKEKGLLLKRSSLLEIAECAALHSKTTKEAYSVVPAKERRSIPEVVMEALVTCSAIISDGKKADRRCRKQKISGYDYCSAHCDPLFLTAPHTDVPASDISTAQAGESPTSARTFPRGIAAIIKNMASFLKSNLSTIFVNKSQWSINCIEDSVLCDETKPFPLGLKVRKLFRGYGFHDGRIVKICRKFFVDSRKQVQRPVLVYRVRYNDGDQEDLLRNEISSLCQVYDRNVSPEAPPSTQIPAGTLFEMLTGNIVRVLEHKTPVELFNRNEGGTVVVQYDNNTSERVELDLLNLQMSVLRKVGNDPSHDTHTASKEVPLLEWPEQERLVSSGPQSDDNSIRDEQYVICRGLFLRRKSSTCLEACGAHLQSLSNVDDPDDARPGCTNTRMWDPGNGFQHLSWDPFLTVMCEICNIDKDDHQVVICDKCHSGFHTYCVRPVMVVIPKDDWLCSNCTTGQPNAISFEEYSAKVNSQDVADFIKLPITAPSEIASSHVSFRYQKNDWRIPTPLLSKEEYDNSLLSFVAAMKYCGMSTYSEKLMYPASGDAKQEMNDSSLDVDVMQPVSRRNLEIFRAFKENLKLGLFPPVKNDEHFGFSVEALTVIQRHTLIGEYVGEVVTLEQSDEIRSDSLMVLLQTGDKKTSLIIDPTRAGNIARFLSGINNRSLLSRRKANVRTLRFSIDGRVRVALFTSKRIEPGEKLQYDYNAGVKGKSIEELAESGFYDTSNFF